MGLTVCSKELNIHTHIPHRHCSVDRIRWAGLRAAALSLYPPEPANRGGRDSKTCCCLHLHGRVFPLPGCWLRAGLCVGAGYHLWKTPEGAQCEWCVALVTLLETDEGTAFARQPCSQHPWNAASTNIQVSIVLLFRQAHFLQ